MTDGRTMVDYSVSYASGERVTRPLTIDDESAIGRVMGFGGGRVQSVVVRYKQRPRDHEGMRSEVTELEYVRNEV